MYSGPYVVPVSQRFGGMGNTTGCFSHPGNKGLLLPHGMVVQYTQIEFSDIALVYYSEEEKTA